MSRTSDGALPESEEAVPPSHPEPRVAAEITQLTERLFRDEAGKLVATLTRHFGVQHLSLAEDVVQEALARALKIWPFYGVPKNPSAWLTQVARNLALDVIRREKSFRDKEAAIVASLEQSAPEMAGSEEPRAGGEIGDDRLRMLFVCCHPHLPPDSHVPLALKTLCGFSTEEIARAFLSTEASIAKRLVRAKQRLRDDAIPFEIPEGPELATRLESVLQTLYLLFNEGYKASGGDRLIRGELCDESIRLMSLLTGHPALIVARAHALLALMYFNAARLAAREDEEGNLLLLEQQDRTRWDRQKIALGMQHLACSAAGEELSEYHLQAGIAACHCTAPDFASTDWRQILALYDRLGDLDPSPVVALNRAIAVAHVHGPGEGLAALHAIRDRSRLEQYHLFHAVLGEFEVRLKRPHLAATHFRKALELARTRAERDFLARRVAECTPGAQ